MKNEQAKPKKTCYQCTYSRSVPGDAHSMCKFLWASSKHIPPQGGKHGIKNGWWMFPFNYDPAWMIGECSEFDDGRDKVAEIPPHLDKKPMTPDECHPKVKTSSSRKVGRTEAMIQGIATHLKDNKKIGVAGLKDPAPILKRLSELGVNAKASVMSCFRGESEEECYTGYLFKKMDDDAVNVSIDDIPDFDLGKTYFTGDNVQHGGSTWVFEPKRDRHPSSTGIYPGTGNGWKIKK